jgi:voltage-gated potassium channel
MSLNIRIAMGLGGVPPHENTRVYEWEKRLHIPVLTAITLALPAFYMTVLSGERHLMRIGHVLDAVVFLTFLAELLIMLAVAQQKTRYLAYNWLTLAIILSTASSVLQPQLPTDLAALLRLLQLAVVGLMSLRLANALRRLTPGSTPYILMIGFGLMLLAGGGFYWLEPTIQSYWDGVWLAFVSGMTVGYGDLVPTTGPSRLFAGLVIVMTYAVMSLVTASIAAFFVGKEEKQMRREMHQDIRALRGDLQRLHEELASLKATSARKEQHDPAHT